MFAFRNKAHDVLQNTAVRHRCRSCFTSWGLAPHDVTGECQHDTRAHALRWFAALPLAILAAAGVGKIVGFFVRTDFHHIWIRMDITLFLMAAAFVSIVVWVAPSRKDSVGRIALSVVVFWGGVFIAEIALVQATTTAHFPGWQLTQWTADVSPGFCILLGGVLAYLLCRDHETSQALET